MSRSRCRREPADVELNLAAMLDMAFQLLTFFILTFRPAPIEGQVSLRLPPPEPVSGVGMVRAGADTSKTDPVKGVNTLTITIFATPTGAVQSMGVGETPVNTLAKLEGKLQTVFQDAGNPFDQVILQVGRELRYEELMKVVEVCSRQTLPNGQKLSKLSFVELPGG